MLTIMHNNRAYNTEVMQVQRIAGLHAMGDRRPVGRAREIGHRDGAKRAGAGGEEAAAGEFDVHDGFAGCLARVARPE